MAQHEKRWTDLDVNRVEALAFGAGLLLAGAFGLIGMALHVWAFPLAAVVGGSVLIAKSIRWMKRQYPFPKE